MRPKCSGRSSSARERRAATIGDRIPESFGMGKRGPNRDIERELTSHDHTGTNGSLQPLPETDARPGGGFAGPRSRAGLSSLRPEACSEAPEWKRPHREPSGLGGASWYPPDSRLRSYSGRPDLLAEADACRGDTTLASRSFSELLSGSKRGWTHLFCRYARCQPLPSRPLPRSRRHGRGL